MYLTPRRQVHKHPSSGLFRDEMRASMNSSTVKRRFWLNSRMASFWLAGLQTPDPNQRVSRAADL